MLAEHPHRFSKTIFAEMRGVSDEKGNSPFWEWLQEHFFSIDFTMADYLTGIGKKGFIADLMPKLPIYINLLSKEAQAVIGEVHDNTRPALKLLE
ncbi:arginine N-succinyltransferase, partial [Vibrio sp. 10N.222.49.C9]